MARPSKKQEAASAVIVRLKPPSLRLLNSLVRIPDEDVPDTAAIVADWIRASTPAGHPLPDRGPLIRLLQESLMHVVRLVDAVDAIGTPRCAAALRAMDRPNTSDAANGVEAWQAIG